MVLWYNTAFLGDPIIVLLGFVLQKYDVFARAFHGSDRCSRVGPAQGVPARLVILPPDPTRLDP